MVAYIYGCNSRMYGQPDIYYVSIYTDDYITWSKITDSKEPYTLEWRCGSGGGTEKISLPVMRLCKDCATRVGILW